MTTMPTAKKKRSGAYAVFNLKCATCREGDMFETPTISFSKPFQMHKHCPHCGADLEPEPGFYYGAMFISYGITVWPLFGLAALFRWGLGWSLQATFLVTLLVTAVLFVYIFRLSRSLYLNMMVKYRPERA